eukprot:3860758-Karenia_brevis.AAC.1
MYVIVTKIWRRVAENSPGAMLCIFSLREFHPRPHRRCHDDSDDEDDDDDDDRHHHHACLCRYVQYGQ